MKKLLMVLVGALGVAGLITVASAHMGGGSYAGQQGYGSGYGWTGGMGPGAMHQGMGYGWTGPGAMRGWTGSGPGPVAMNGWAGSGMGPGAMHSGTGGGWMSWMGNMFGTGRMPHRGFDRCGPAETPPAAPDSTTR
jgi:hypothetical protein